MVLRREIRLSWRNSDAKGGNAYVLAKRPSAHMSVLMVAQVPRLVVDEALEGRRAAAGSVLHGCWIV